MIAGGAADPTEIAQGVRAAPRGVGATIQRILMVTPGCVPRRTLLKGVYYYEDDFRFDPDSPGCSCKARMSASISASLRPRCLRMAL